MTYETSIKKEIDYNEIRYFKEVKDRKDAIGLFPDLLYMVDEFRSVLNKPMSVSPLQGTLVALDGHNPTSFHYPSRGARAGDFFPHCDPYTTQAALMKFNPFTGIGFYFDTHFNGKPLMMMHFDLRPAKSVYDKMYWIRDPKFKTNGGDGYYSLGKAGSEEKFFSELAICMKTFYDKNYKK